MKTHVSVLATGAKGWTPVTVAPVKMLRAYKKDSLSHLLHQGSVDISLYTKDLKLLIFKLAMDKFE